MTLTTMVGATIYILSRAIGCLFGGLFLSTMLYSQCGLTIVVRVRREACIRRYTRGLHNLYCSTTTVVTYGINEGRPVVGVRLALLNGVAGLFCTLTTIFGLYRDIRWGAMTKKDAREICCVCFSIKMLFRRLIAHGTNKVVCAQGSN